MVNSNLGINGQNNIYPKSSSNNDINTHEFNDAMKKAKSENDSKSDAKDGLTEDEVRKNIFNMMISQSNRNMQNFNSILKDGL